MEGLWQEFCARWGLGSGEKRRLPMLLGLLVLGLCLMCVGGRGDTARPDNTGGSANSAVNGSASGAANCSVNGSSNGDIEQRLAAVLSRIDGAGDVSVVLTYEAGARTEYAVNESAGRDGAASRDVVLVGSSRDGLAVQVQEPQVRGVLVVADGAGDAAVRQMICDAVASLLGVSANRIVICPQG